MTDTNPPLLSREQFEASVFRPDDEPPVEFKRQPAARDISSDDDCSTADHPDMGDGACPCGMVIYPEVISRDVAG